MTEYMIPMPEDPYGIAKLACEQELRVTHEMFGLDYTIIRPHNVYGEKQNIADRYRNVVGIFMNQEITRNLPLSWADAATQRSTRASSRTAIEAAELRTHHLGQCVN
jgi:nucleoside-diphosphate-sugar epimerase